MLRASEFVLGGALRDNLQDQRSHQEALNPSLFRPSEIAPSIDDLPILDLTQPSL